MFQYGYAPKGSSVVMYRNPEYRSYQWFIQPNWPGGIYPTPTFAGSRPGAIIAACWATMMYQGLDGYVESTRKIVETTHKIANGIRDIPELFVCGNPEICVVAFGSKLFNIYTLSDAMAKCGWSLNPLQYPSSIHICVTLLHTEPGVADKFLVDLRTNVKQLMKNASPPTGSHAVMYGKAGSLPDTSLVTLFTGRYIDAYYGTIRVLQSDKKIK